jgi:hypothetical protein
MDYAAAAKRIGCKFNVLKMAVARHLSPLERNLKGFVAGIRPVKSAKVEAEAKLLS